MRIPLIVSSKIQFMEILFAKSPTESNQWSGTLHNYKSQRSSHIRWDAIYLVIQSPSSLCNIITQIQCAQNFNTLIPKYFTSFLSVVIIGLQNELQNLGRTSHEFYFTIIILNLTMMQL